MATQRQTISNRMVILINQIQKNTFLKFIGFSCIYIFYPSQNRMPKILMDARRDTLQRAMIYWTFISCTKSRARDVLNKKNHSQAKWMNQWQQQHQRSSAPNITCSLWSMMFFPRQLYLFCQNHSLELYTCSVYVCVQQTNT